MEGWKLWDFSVQVAKMEPAEENPHHHVLHTTRKDNKAIFFPFPQDSLAGVVFQEQR